MRERAERKVGKNVMKKVRGRPFDFQFGTDMNRREKGGGEWRGAVEGSSSVC